MAFRIVTVCKSGDTELSRKFLEASLLTFYFWNLLPRSKFKFWNEGSR